MNANSTSWDESKQLFIVMICKSSKLRFENILHLNSAYKSELALITQDFIHTVKKQQLIKWVNWILDFRQRSGKEKHFGANISPQSIPSTALMLYFLAVCQVELKTPLLVLQHFKFTVGIIFNLNKRYFHVLLFLLWLTCSSPHSHKVNAAIQFITLSQTLT